MVLVAFVWCAGLALDTKLEEIAPNRPAGPTSYQVFFKGDALKVMALGYDHALAVYYWLKTIQYCAYCSDYKLPMDNLYAMTDAITTLDPHYKFAYTMSWTFLMTYDTRPMKVKIEEGEKILQKGWRNNPDDWLMAQDLAFHLFFYEQKYDEAADLYDAAFKLRPDFPLYSRFAARLRASAGYPKLALTGLHIQYESTEDEVAKEKLQIQMQRVKAEIIADELDKYVEKYRTEKGECPINISQIVKEGYIDRIPPDGLGGTYEIDEKECRVKSTTIGRLEVFYPPDKDKYFK